MPRGAACATSDGSLGRPTNAAAPRDLTSFLQGRVRPLVMRHALDSRDSRFRGTLRRAARRTKREVSEDVDATVRAIIADVRARGDAALCSTIPRGSTGSTLDAAGAARHAPRRSRRRSAPATRETLDALTLARDRIARYHERQMPQDDRYTDALGVELGSRWTRGRMRSASTCPAARRAIPVSVLMNAVPAKVAGVPRIVMVVPTPDGELNPLVLAAARSRRRRRDLPRRRRAGRRRAGLRHGDHRAGGQDRRARQRLCRRRQAPGVRHGRHRHDRRAVRGAGHRRRATTIRTGSPPTCWPRPSTTRRRSRS